MPFRRIVSLGGVELLLSIDDALARRLRSTALWRGTKEGESPVSSPSGGKPGHSGGHAKNNELLDRVSEIVWYHTIDLGDGFLTPGAFDHSPELSYYPIPAKLNGMRVLDIATYDGYWAFEFERRGAAEVVATDIGSWSDLDLAQSVRAQNSPEELTRKTGAGFLLAKELLHSKVQREVISVYDLSPERLGKFDFVFCSDLLLHLMNPMKALEKIRSVVSGQIVVANCYSPFLPGRTAEYLGGVRRCVWWSFSLGCLQQMIRDADFREVRVASTFKTKDRADKRPLSIAVFTAQA